MRTHSLDLNQHITRAGSGFLVSKPLWGELSIDEVRNVLSGKAEDLIKFHDHVESGLVRVKVGVKHDFPGSKFAIGNRPWPFNSAGDTGK
jgi:hypothetical protein